MRGDQDFYAPLQYNPVWLWAGAGLLLIAACWLVWLVLPARVRAAEDRPAPGPAAPSDIRGLQAAYVARIDAVAAAAGQGRMAARAAHQELSLLVRSFWQDATGKDATRMTLEELDRHGLQKLARAVAAIYPAAFREEPNAAVEDSARAARQAVLGWN